MVSASARLARASLALLVLGALAVVGPGAQAATGLHSWSLDEDPGDGTMHDDGSPATNGSWMNIQAGVPGLSGTAYRFDGSSRVTVPDSASLDPGSETFTATVHVKFTRMPTDANGGDYDVIRKGLGSTNGGYWKLEVYPNSAHTKANGLCQMKGTSNHIKIVGAPTSLNDGRWHTITCTKTSSDVTLTVDGTSYRKAVVIGSIANSDPLTIGADKFGDDAYTGDLDEVTYSIGGGAPASPSISGFTPSCGSSDDPVTINGTAFTGTTDVAFGGTSVAGNFSVVSDSRITTSVPSGARTGRITVTTPTGSDTSSASFTVPCQPAGSITEVQRKHAGANATSISATLGSRSTAGDVLVALVVVSQASSPSFDTPSGWTKGFTPARGALFWKVSDGTERTVTVDLSSGSTAKVMRMWVVELRGVDPANPLDQHGSATFGSATTSVTATTDDPVSASGDWTIAVVSHNGDNGGGASATNGFAILTPTDSREVSASDSATASGVVSTTLSWATARTGSWIIAAFRPA
jgi:hypothetical protein